MISLRMNGHSPVKMTKLEKFLFQTAQTHPRGLSLADYVSLAFNQGFRGKERGDLTKRVHRALKILVRRGIIHRKDCTNLVEYVA